ncbi:MAG: hypothetical protein AAGJ81_02315 [Verrucomicrobiota bacterium]
MKSNVITLALAGLMVSATAHSAVVTISALDLRSGGVYGHDANVGTPWTGTPAVPGTQVSGGTVLINEDPPTNVNTAANPLDYFVRYSGLDLDGDSTANDTVSFTMRFDGSGASPNAMNQGIDAGFGNLEGITISMLSVSGTTTDNGDIIVFDGFTSINIGKGSGIPASGSVDVTGAGETTQTANVSTTENTFQFVQDSIDFTGPVASILLNNSVQGAAGTMVARNYDLQFSTTPIPEANSFAFLGGLIAMGCVVARRRR